MMLDDEALKLMVEHGTYWCPTLSVYIPEHIEDDTELRRRIVARSQEGVPESHEHGRQDRVWHGCRSL